MSFTEKDILEQQKAFADMKEEFSRITSRFDSLMQEMGWTSETLQQADTEPVTPELKALMDKAHEEARRAGAARAAQFAAQMEKGCTTTGRGRAGIIRL